MPAKPALSGAILPPPALYSALAVELRDTACVRPYERNPRKNDQAVDAVAASLKEFGFRQPIVVDGDGVIIAGHTRYKAALKLGLSQIPVHVATDLTPEQIKAYRIADNKSAEIAEWDFEILPIEIAELQEVGFDLDLLAFNEKELTQLLNVNVRQGLTDPDEVPEPPDEPTTRRGDIWRLGEHRLMCGDSANPADLDKLLDGHSIQMCHTDPPYGVALESRSNNAIAAGLSSFPAQEGAKTTGKMRAKDRPLANDNLSEADFEQKLDSWFNNIARVLEPGRAAYIWGGYANLANYPQKFKKNGLYWSQCLIWNKMHPVMNRKDFLSCYELCFYCWREGAAHKFFGPNNERDLWEVKKEPSRRTVHPTQKPTELATRAIQLSSKPGENVLELFGGSGSTLIACEQTGRKCFAMEIDEAFCDVIVQRWAEFTGKEPIPIPANDGESNED